MKIAITELGELGPFEYQWPDSVERFERGYECTATVDGVAFRIRHGIGARQVYGRERVHSVTWVNGQPTVEGVAADDFELSRCLVSAIRRPDRKLVRTPEELPAGYERLTIVRHDEEINAPYTRMALAAKIEADDGEAWPPSPCYGSGIGRANSPSRDSQGRRR